MTMRDWLDYTNTLIQLSVLGGLVWYAIETLKIRKSAQAQARVSQEQVAQTQKMFDLQSKIEAQRNKVSLYLTIKPTIEPGHPDAFFQATNLSTIGIWLESLTVYISEGHSHTVPIEQKLMPGEPFSFALRDELVSLCGVTNQLAHSDAWVLLNYQTAEGGGTQETKHYNMDVHRFGLTNVHLV